MALTRLQARSGQATTWALAATATFLMAPGCQSVPSQVGRDGQYQAVYHRGTLWADLPATIRVPAVVAAADMGLRDRGYAVRTVRTTDDYGRLVAEPHNPGLLESVAVDVRPEDGALRVGVTVKPMGDH